MKIFAIGLGAAMTFSLTEPTPFLARQGVMRIFIDEAGDFGWAPKQISLHCAVIVCNSSLVELYRRHLAWEQSILGEHRRRELKASTLTDEQLETFVRSVILPEQDPQDKDCWH